MKVRIGTHALVHFEIWLPVINSDAQTVSWSKFADGTGNIDPKPGGDIDLYASIPYQPGQAIRNLTDTAGVNMFSVGDQAYQMYIVSISPLVGLDGRLDGYVHKLSTRLRETNIQVLGNI